MALTRRQKQVLDYISDFVNRNGYSPSYEELAQGLDLASLATVHKHIQALQTKQYLTRNFNHSRSLEVTNKYFDEQRMYRASRPEPARTEVPLLGRIAAGAPVEAIAGQDALAFGDFTGSTETFALQVRGDSMIEDHICDGDYVLIEKTATARNGDTVVALVDGVETTLKRFYDEGEHVRLQPANAAMRPIIVPKVSVQIQGRLIAVLRKYR